jgi:hypothetical protein
MVGDGVGVGDTLGDGVGLAEGETDGVGDGTVGVGLGGAVDVLADGLTVGDALADGLAVGDGVRVGPVGDGDGVVAG